MLIEQPKGYNTAVTSFFITTLGVSIVGMISLIVLKRWEDGSGRVLGGRARPKIGQWAHYTLTWFEYVLPALLRSGALATYAWARAFFHRLSALVVLITERGLERLLRGLRRNTAVPQNDENASAFLREVSAHKAELLRSARKRAIYEE